jgi:hypothetical protein
MKVALLITGELRTFEFCKHVIKSAIIDKYDTDVFLALSCQEDKLEEMNKVIDFFKPIETHIADNLNYIENHMELVNIGEYLKCTPFGTDPQQSSIFHIHLIRRILTVFHSVYHAYRLLKRHSDNNSVTYDHIFRIRTDHIVWSDVINEFRQDFTWTPQGHINANIADIMLYNKSIDSIKNISRLIEVNFDIPIKNTIYVSNHGTTPSISFKNSLGWCDADYWIHSHDLIPTIMTMFDSLPEILNESFSPDTFPKGPTVETFFCKFLQKHNITIKNSRIKTMLVLEYDRYNI